MRILGVLLASVEDRLLRKVGPAVDIGNIRAHHLHRVVRDPSRIRAHIGDQANAAFVAEFDAFVKPLRQHHRFLHGEAKPARGILLQFAGDERRNGIPFLFLRDDGLHEQFRPPDGVEDMIGFRLILHLDVPALELYEPRVELWRFVSFEFGDDRPIFFGHECLDFALPVHDHAQRYRLNAARGDSAPHLVPKKRAYLVTHEAVEDAARLLRVDHVLIDASGIFHGRPDRLRSDLIEEDAKHFGIVPVEDFLQMLANRLAFTIRVGGQKDAVRAFGGGAQFFDDLLFSGYDFVDRLEIVLDVDSELALRQILDVAERGLHDEFLAEILIDRVRFRG